MSQEIKCLPKTKNTGDLVCLACVNRDDQDYTMSYQILLRRSCTRKGLSVDSKLRTHIHAHFSNGIAASSRFAQFGAFFTSKKMLP